MKSFRTIAPWVVLSIVFATGQTTVGHALSKHDLTPQVTIFSNHSKDFRAMSKPLSGQDLEVLLELDHVAATQADRLLAANVALQIYDAISSEQDRSRARRILKEQLLDYYSWVLDQDVTRTSGLLTFAKVPAAAQLGLRMKDDMRAAKEKIDAIIASIAK